MSPKRNVNDDILYKLESFISGGGLLPPCKTKPGETPKVNVAGLCRELKIKETDAQHFYRKDLIRNTVNALAIKQGLEPIVVTLDREAADKSIQEKFVRSSSQSREDAQTVVEVKSQYEAALAELNNTKKKLLDLQEENSCLHERLNMVKHGILFRE